MKVYKVMFNRLIQEDGGAGVVSSGDYVKLEDYQELERERDVLLDLVKRYHELPLFCLSCIQTDKGEVWLEWDGSTLRCPTCSHDALEEPG